MAINVNTVYTTVLSILNKEQRGYLTPDEFNKTATQVQLEIFEKYFEDLNQQLRIPQTNNEYANRQQNLDTAISAFKTSGPTTFNAAGNILGLSLIQGGNGYSVPDINVQTNSITGSGTGLTVDTNLVNVNISNLLTPGTGYGIQNNYPTSVAPLGGAGLTVNILSFNNSGVPSISINTQGQSYNVGDVFTIVGGNNDCTFTLTSPPNGIIQNVTIVNSGANYAVGDTVSVIGGNIGATFTVDSINTSSYFLPPNDLHRIGTVIFKDSIEIERVDRNDLLYQKLSPLTKPSKSFPVYLYEQISPGVSGSLAGETRIFVEPKTINTASDVSVSYIRKPADVVWGYSNGNLGQYIYDSSASTQFEINDTEQTQVILKILEYAGVIIRDPQIVQMAAQASQADEINSKS